VKIKLDTLTVALILSGLALSITLGFTSGWVTSIAVQEGGLVDAIARMAQIVPGTHTVETDSDIPAATDLTPLKTFWKARQRVLQGYVYPDEIDDAELTYGAIRGMLNALGDPYTRFMDPDQYKEFRTESTGHFEGIGAMLMMEVNEVSGEKEVIVSSVLPEGPAATTDLAADDVILAVDEAPAVHRWS
jgi:C-terminal processing protease CtpA/Prc